MLDLVLQQINNNCFSTPTTQTALYCFESSIVVVGIGFRAADLYKSETLLETTTQQATQEDRDN